MSTLTRREVVGIGAAAGVAALGVSQVAAQSRTGRRVVIDARPGAVTIDTSTTAVIVVDMQNDFGSKGGMFERAGIDISGIQKAVAPTARVLDAARKAGVKVFYLKMAYQPDLSDLGEPDSVNRVRHLQLGVGQHVTAPDGRPSRVLVRDTWNSEIVDELKPHPSDYVLVKKRRNAFHATELDFHLRARGVDTLIVGGVATNLGVENTVRDGWDRDYNMVVVPDISVASPAAAHDYCITSVFPRMARIMNVDEVLAGFK